MIFQKNFTQMSACLSVIFNVFTVVTLKWVFVFKSVPSFCGVLHTCITVIKQPWTYVLTSATAVSLWKYMLCTAKFLSLFKLTPLNSLCTWMATIAGGLVLRLQLFSFLYLSSVFVNMWRMWPGVAFVSSVKH